MPLLVPIIMSVVVSWLLIETELAIPVFIWFWILIALMFFWPVGAAWFISLTVGLIIVMLLISFWAEAIGVLLGVFMFIMFVLASLSILAR